MNPSYLDTLKDFVEGKKDLREWPAWWRGSERDIALHAGRTHYLKLKLHWQEGACQILDHYGISYELNETINWLRCKECGEILFQATPHKTTSEQITEFARNSKLPDKEQIEREGWIHPGVFCPIGCTAVLISYREK